MHQKISYTKQVEREQFWNLAQNQTAAIIFQSFLWFSLDSLIWAKSRQCQVNWVYAAHLEYRSLVLRMVRNYWRLSA